MHSNNDYFADIFPNNPTVMSGVAGTKAALKRKIGRPRQLNNAKATAVFLHEKTIEIAHKLGDGNVSTGLPIAVQAMVNAPLPADFQ